MDLTAIKCVPCQGGVQPIQGKELDKYKQEVPSWELYEGSTRIRKEFVFDNFKGAINFVNKVADQAEREGHHPNIYVFDYKHVRIELWTHKINGLHKNDFILAAKI